MPDAKLRPKKSGPKLKHALLEEGLVKSIEKQGLKAHDQFLSEKSISEHYQVNFLTARRSLASMEQKGLIYRIPRKGTFIAPRRKAGKILIVYSTFNQTTQPLRFWRHYGEISFFMRMVELAGEDKLGYDPVFISDEKYFGEIRGDLRHHYPDLAGVIFFRNIALLTSSRETLSALKIPFLFYGSSLHLPRLKDVPRLLYDEEEISRLALDHLLDKGARRIGILYLESSPIHQFRHEKARAYLTKKGIKVEEDLLINAHYDTASDVLRHRILQKKIGRFALYATDDQFLLNAIQDLQNEGVRIPGDLQVVGVNNSPICEILRPGLSSVDLPLAEDAGRAYQAMLDLIGGKKQFFDERSRVRLVERSST